MDKTTHDVRLAHWKQIIEQCQARHEGQTAKQWLSENDINDKSYYYWLRKIRKQVYEESSATAMLPSKSEDHTIDPVPASSEPPVTFAEIPFSVGTESSNKYEGSFKPVAVVKAAGATIAFSNGIDNNLLSGIIREVLSHA